jgi:hypothetical protein
MPVVVFDPPPRRLSTWPRLKPKKLGMVSARPHGVVVVPGGGVVPGGAVGTVVEITGEVVGEGGVVAVAPVGAGGSVVVVGGVRDPDRPARLAPARRRRAVVVGATVVVVVVLAGGVVVVVDRCPTVEVGDRWSEDLAAGGWGVPQADSEAAPATTMITSAVFEPE